MRFSLFQQKRDLTCKSPVTTPMYQEDIDDEEMHHVVGGNAVDYNTNDSKYDDFSENENDYIATGDIISKQTNYNNNYTTTATTESTNDYSLNDSLDDNILNSQISTGYNKIGKLSGPMSLPAIPVSQQTLTNNKSSFYCDSTATNNTYNLEQIHQQQHDLLHTDSEENQIDDDKLDTDDMQDRISSSMYSSYMNGGSNFLSDHMYGDPMEAADNNIVLKHQQEIDPNDVYTEDYEEDLIQGSQMNNYNNSYNNKQQHQMPYYNYQEDYFNEEDEYKYLEMEREEAAGMEAQPHQPQPPVSLIEMYCLYSSRIFQIF